MRWIADADKKAIELAICAIDTNSPLRAKAHLEHVLANMRRLEVEQPNPEPRIVKLSEAELRVIYPERFTERQG